MDEKQFNELVEKVGKEAADKIKAKFTVLEQKQAADLAEIKKGIVTDVRLKEMEETYVKQIEKLENSLREQGIKLLAIEGNTGRPARLKSLTEQATEQIEAKKEAWESFTKGTSQNFKMSLQYATKAAQTMQVGNSVTPDNGYYPFPEIDTTITPIIRSHPFILDYSNVSAAKSPLFVYVERYNPQGDAAFTAEGGVKPLISFQWRTHKVTAKKVTEKIKMSTETLKDIPDMIGQINTELKTVLDLKVDEKLLSGNSNTTPEEIDGLRSMAGGFVITYFNGKVPTANKFDVIKVVAAQIRNVNFIPTHIFMNDLDATSMDLTKDTMGRYLLPPFTTPNGNVISGITVVPSNRVPQDEFVMGDMSKFEVKMWEMFEVTMGWVNDDFEKNLVTVIGEARLFSFIRQNYLPAFCSDTFSNVLTLISA